MLEISELNQESLDKGLEIQQVKGGRIGEILLNQKFIQEIDLARALSEQLNLELTPSLPADINTEFTDQLGTSVIPVLPLRVSADLGVQLMFRYSYDASWT